MDSFQNNVMAEEKFYASKKSQLDKTRRWLWIGVLVGIAIAAVNPNISKTVLVYTAMIMVLFTGGLDWFMRKQMKSGQALVTVTEESIESSLFQGKTKRYLWKEITGAIILSSQQVTSIQLDLIASPARPDKRNFWNGVNEAKPFILLSPFSPEEQERLLEAINLRISHQSKAMGRENVPVSNHIADEREFQEQLKALAPHTWVTYGLLGLNVAIWCFTLGLGAEVLQSPAEKLFGWGGNAASEVQRGEWWRLISAMFLHSGILHLSMNMIGLACIGTLVERIYGHRLFSLIYFGSGLMGGAMSLHFSAQKSVAVGASGAVFGIAGALLIAVFEHRKKLPTIFCKQTLSGMGFFIVYSLVQGFTHQGIDNAAHIGGLIGGMLLAFILPERFDVKHFRQNVGSRSISAAILITTLIIGTAASAPKASIDQRMVFANFENFQRVFKQLSVELEALKQEQLDVKAGKISEIESDERGRLVRAPVFRQIHNDLTKISLPTGDFRERMLKDVRRFTELLAEAFEMKSIVNTSTSKVDPINPVRMGEIESELLIINKRMASWTEDIKVMQKRH